MLYKTRNIGAHYIAGIKVNRDKFQFYNAGSLKIKGKSIRRQRIEIYDLLNLITTQGRKPLYIIGVPSKKKGW